MRFFFFLSCRAIYFFSFLAVMPRRFTLPPSRYMKPGMVYSCTQRQTEKKKKKGERSTVASWHENTAQRSSYNPRRKPHRRTRKALIHQARKKMRFLSNSALFFFFVYLCVRFCFDSERRVENNMNRTSEIRHYTHKKKKRRPTRRTRSFVLAHVCRLYGR